MPTKKPKDSEAVNPALNSLTHGGCAETLFIPGDNPEEFEKLVESYHATHRPATNDHSALVWDLAHARWMLWRRQRAQGSNEQEIYLTEPKHWTPDHHHSLHLMDRYFTQAQRAFQRALNNVRAVKKDEENSLKWREQLALQKQKVKMLAEQHAATLALKKFKIAELVHKEELRIQAAADKQDFKAFLQELHDKNAAAPKDPAEVPPVYRHPDCEETFIEQQIWLKEEDGELTIDSVEPTNSQIRQVIKNRNKYPVPPSRVVRCYEIEGNIPNTEEWEFLKDGHWDDFDPETPEWTRINIYYDFEKWAEIADEEDEEASEPRA